MSIESLRKTCFSKIAKDAWHGRLARECRSKTLLFGWFEPEHYDKAARDFFQGLSFAAAIVDRRIADTFAKQRAERSQALKANLKADVGDAQARRPQKLFGPVNPSLNQVLVRRGIERVAKQAQKMISGQACLF